jgi:glycosyltransferase involved in cell wall biosynthesis
MRVVHVPFGFFPSTAGGTEVYVLTLAQELQTFGVESVVAAPGTNNEHYSWASIPVMRFAGEEALSLPAVYGSGDARAAAEFARILDATTPDVVHFHALTAAASVLAMQEAKRRGIPVVLTYHTPTVSCVRGWMMRWGTTPCNGRMEPRLCSACALHGKGLPRRTAGLLSWLPAGMLNWLGSLMSRGPMATALRMPAMVRLRHSTTRQAFSTADVIVSVCEWVSAVLRSNDVPGARIMLSRQGVARQPALIASSRTATTFSNERPLRLAFFGRVESQKGVHVLAAALALDPALPVVLDVFGLRSDEQFWQQLLKQTSSDARVRLLSPVAADAVVTTMQQYELVVVPSLWLETGPLVVYEAMAAGVPVLGSRLGGIAELVQHDVTGALVEAADPQAWLAMLHQIIREPERLLHWQQQLHRPRTMHDVAVDMLALYKRIISQSSSQELPA